MAVAIEGKRGLNILDGTSNTAATLHSTQNSHFQKHIGPTLTVATTLHCLPLSGAHRL